MVSTASHPILFWDSQLFTIRAQSGVALSGPFAILIQQSDRGLCGSVVQRLEKKQ
jgi:hypothetical protein